SGTVIGNPTQAGSFSASVTVTDSKFQTATQPFTLAVVTTPLAILDANGNAVSALPSATVGTSYTQVLTAQGGSQRGYVWSIAQGTLPPGLSTSNSSGCPNACALLISGTPTQA